MKLPTEEIFFKFWEEATGVRDMYAGSNFDKARKVDDALSKVWSGWMALRVELEDLADSMARSEEMKKVEKILSERKK
jgi:hypothetical protein